MKTDDGQMHNVELYIEVSPHWAMNLSNQSSVSETFTKDGFVFLKSGTQQQNILGTKGDDVRIDWGYFYLGTIGIILLLLLETVIHSVKIF